MNKKVLVSTDIGSDIDDALSLNVMFNSGIDLKAIYTVNGDVISRAYIAKHMVNLFEKDIEVFIGESLPLGGNVTPYSYFEDCYIDDRFIDKKETEITRDIVFINPKKAGIKSNGLEDLAQKLSKEKYSILSLGPLTNLSKVILKYPKIIQNIEELYVIACRFDEFDSNEHNVRFDIPSAQIVFNSEIPITIIPGELCSNYRMEISSLDNLTSKTGKYVKKMAEGFIGTKIASEIYSNQLLDLIKRENATCFEKKSNDIEEERKRLERKHDLSVNLDDLIFAAMDPKDYFKQFNSLMDHLVDPDFKYPKGNFIVDIMKLIIPKEISVADVYVPYCFLNRDKIKIERANVSITDEGYSRKEIGNKHGIVTNLDYMEFRKFLRQNLK